MPLRDTEYDDAIPLVLLVLGAGDKLRRLNSLPSTLGEDEILSEGL